MSERPSIVLATLLTAALFFTTVLIAGLVSLGSSGAAALAMTVVGAFTACVYFLAELRRVPLLSFVLVGLTVLSALAFLRTAFAYWRHRRILASLPLLPVEGYLAALARNAGAVALYRTPAVRPAAFCFGLLRTRVVVSDGLLAQLDPDEQAAAISHEAQHARVREPLKCLLARLAAATFFWMPMLADLFDRYLLVKELAADREAQARTSRRALASALSKVICETTPAGAVGLADFAAPRVDRLFDPEAPLPPIWRARRLALSAVAAFVLGLVIAFPAHLDLSESTHLQPMLTSMSLHGLPGMAAGLIFNGAIMAASTLVFRRYHRRDSSRVASRLAHPTWDRGPV